MVTKYKTIRTEIPAALKRPCPKPWRKAGGPETVADFIDRGDVNAAGLAVCSAQMDKIIQLDKP